MPSPQPSAPARPVMLVVPHTHWDRAWYWPFERFRVRLIEFFTALEALYQQDSAYRFLLDGQAIMLEDYLEACPDRRDFLREMAQAGRLKIGPLYVLPDVYCTGGEAFIRNLLVGAALGKAFGGLSRVVHLPDTFGIIPEMPMLVAGAGFDTFTFMRGVTGAEIGDRTRLFHWIGPDGSRVQVFRLRDGYANAARLGITPPARGMVAGFDLDKATEQLRKAAANQCDGQTGPYLLLAGVDHRARLHPGRARVTPRQPAGRAAGWPGPLPR